jgi:hypothetical protein
MYLIWNTPYNVLWELISCRNLGEHTVESIYPNNERAKKVRLQSLFPPPSALATTLGKNRASGVKKPLTIPKPTQSWDVCLGDSSPAFVGLVWRFSTGKDSGKKKVVRITFMKEQKMATQNTDVTLWIGCTSTVLLKGMKGCLIRNAPMAGPADSPR